MEKHFAILHTIPATIAGLKSLCAQLLPGVTVYNYMDDSLLPRINRAQAVTGEVRAQFGALVSLAASTGPAAILTACSTVGDLMEALRPRYPMPLLRIDEPMAEEAAACPGSVIVCATLPSTLGPTLGLIQRKQKSPRPVDHLIIEQAGPLLAAGKREEYLKTIADALSDAAKGHDLVVLAQASMADALELLPENQRRKFLTSPKSGIAALAAYWKQEG